MPFVAAAQNAAADTIAGLIDYASAHTAVPDNTGSGEVSGGSYARTTIAWNAAASGQATSNGAVTINIPAGTTVYAAGWWSAATAGTFYGHGLIGNSLRGFGTVDTAGVTANAIQSAGHGLSNADRVVVYNVLGESLPAGLTEGTVYFVVGAATDTYQVSLTSGGAAVDITAQGEVYWANCVPETFGSAGTLTLTDGQVVVSSNTL